MKRTWRWSVLLTLLLVCVMIPVMAQRAEAADFDVWVGATRVTDENKTDVLGDGTVSYDAGTLTLKGAVITGAHAFTDDSGTNCTANIYAEGALTVTGTGTLSGADYGVYVKPDVTGYEKLTFEDAKLDIGSSVAAASTEMGDITVTGASDMTAAGGTYGFEIRIKGIFEVKSGTVTATGSTLAIKATVDVSQYTDLFVLVNGTAPSASGASEWNKADILGYGGSFKYVRIMPKSDFAEYDLWVGGVQANSLNKDDILGDNTGSAKFDPTTNTLTLNNPKITDTEDLIGGQIYAALNLTIVIEGDTVLDLEGSQYGIVVEGPLVLKGGKLTVKSKTGIFAAGTLTIENGTFDVSGDEYEPGIVCQGNIFINGGSVKAHGGAGIYASMGSLNISGSDTKVTAEGDSVGLAADDKITIASPLVILEPNDGEISSDKKNIVESDGTTVATHVLIAAGEYYDLWVGGVRATSGNKDDILGDSTGSAKFDPATNTLTLNNLTYSGKGHEFGEKGSHAAMCYLGTDPLNLVISGTNSVTQTEVDGDEAFSFGFYSEGPVTVSGTGVLNVSGGTCKARSTTYGMHIENTLTMESGAINAVGGSISTVPAFSVGLGAYTLTMNGGTVQGTGGNVQFTTTGVEAGTLTMNSGTLIGIGGNKVGDEASSSEGIYAGSAEIHGGTVVGTGGTSYWSVGLRCHGKTILDGGKVTATGGTATNSNSCGVMFSGGSYHDPSFIISGTAEITATGGAAKTRSSGIYGFQDFVIAGGKITAKGGEAEEDSSGLMTSDYHNGVGIIIKGGTIDAAGGKANSSSYGISSGKYLTVSGGTIKATSTGNNGKGIYADKEDIKISGDATVVTADGKDSAIYAKNGTISIASPLVILEPNDGEISSDKKNIVESDGTTVATHVLIAAGESYPLWVGGVQATSENKDDILGDGTGSAKFDPTTNTLTLDSPTITGIYKEAAIYAEENLTVTGGGSVIGPDTSTYCIYAAQNLTISGTSALSFSSPRYGVFAVGDIEITGCEVTAKGETAGIYSKKDLTISGTSAVNADAATFCFYSEGNMNIRDSGVTASDTWETGQYCGFQAEGNMKITDSAVNATGFFLGMRIMGESLEISGANTVVTADGRNTAIEATNGKIEISDGAEVNATGVLGSGIYAQKDITISGDSTVVTAEGKTSAITVKNGKITISSPLGIFEPAGGKLDDAQQNICTFDGQIAKHAVIKKFDPIADGLLYTVTWRNYNGAILETDTNVPYGSLPAYNGATPYRPSTSAYLFSFSGWTPALAPVIGDVTYTAQFTSTPNSVPGGSWRPGIPAVTFPRVPGYTPAGTPETTPGGTPGTDPGSVPVGETGLPFTDVSPDSPYLEDIRFVYENGLMIGISDTEFGENLPLTRGMIVTVLHRMEGKPDVTYTGAFEDVPAGEWYTDGVEWAASHGIVLGYGNGKYGPNDNVTREQLAAILNRYAVYKGYTIRTADIEAADIDSISGWAVENVKWAAANGILEKDAADKLRPTEAASRGEIAHAIRVFMEKVAK